MTEPVDHLIVGGGAMGLAAAWQLARRGERVHLIERFEPHHTRGASHGSTRNINNAYAEDLYLDLFDEAFGLWRELESGAPAPLLGLHGLVTQGDQEVVARAHAALTARGADVALLDAAQAHERWRGMRFAGQVLLSRQAGIAYAARALDALAAAAERDGATIERGSRVRAIDPSGGGVRIEVESADGTSRTLSAPSAVVAAGAWSAPLLDGIVELPRLRVTEEHPAHFRPLDPAHEWPSFNHLVSGEHLDTLGGAVYGMPSPGEGVKVGLHRVGHAVDPDARTFRATDEVRERLREHVREWFPGLDAEHGEEISCTYTSTESERFVLDRVGPLTVAAGFSGHGFKFTPAIGRVLADAATGTALPPEPFRLASHGAGSGSPA